MQSVSTQTNFILTQKPPDNSLRSSCIYLDYNATTPIFKEVQDGMLPFLTQHFGNPSSSHVYGHISKSAIDSARADVASMIQATPSEIVFCASGSEADNRAIDIAIHQFHIKSPSILPHIVSSSIEHAAIHNYLSRLESQGRITWTRIPVSANGVISVEHVMNEIRPDTCLLTIMHSNNEIGSIQPIQEISRALLISHPDVLFHCDAAQSIGKVNISVVQLGVSLLTIVGHKFGAPKGIACLYIKQGLDTCPMIIGVGQEGGWRSGTESLLLIVGIGCASRLVMSDLDVVERKMRLLRNRLKVLLQSEFSAGDMKINGSEVDQEQLPNTLSVSFNNINLTSLTEYLSDKVAVSTSSACHSATSAVSRTLIEIGLDHEFAVGTIRVSLGRLTTEEEIDEAARILACGVRLFKLI